MNDQKRTVGKTEKQKNNTHMQKISNDRAFIDLQFPVGDPFDPFEKSKVEAQLIERLAKITLPAQGESSLCGPAVFMYALLEDRPDLYKKYIKDLWDTGEARLGTLNVKPSKATRRPVNYLYSNGDIRISAIDWISLASLRDTENTFMNYDSPADQIAGITMWWGIRSWFKAVGATQVFSNIDVIGSSLRDAVNLSNNISSSHHVVTLIGSGMIHKLGGRKKEHWIVWTRQPIVINTGQPITMATSLDEFIQLELFSWGKKKQFLISQLTLKQFLKYLYGGMVFTKIP